MSKYRILFDDETKVIHETSNYLNITIAPNDIIISLDKDRKYIIDHQTTCLKAEGEIIVFPRSFTVINGSISSGDSIKITKDGEKITIFIKGGSP